MYGIYTIWIMGGEMKMQFTNPSILSDWLAPHSIEWYKQLSKLQNGYKYTWSSTLTEPNGESIFDKEVSSNIKNKIVLDVGCGHGEFTIQNSAHAQRIVGFDVTNDFIGLGKENEKLNVSFVVGNTKQGFPFGAEEFDFAYNRKGPTSAYLSLNKVVKKGGGILGLHPGDESGKELALLFPNFFEKSEGTPVLDAIEQRLEMSNLTHSELEVVNSIEYLHSPEDVIKLRCFGQKFRLYHAMKEENLSEITKVFEQSATENGLPITFSRYIVRAFV